MKLTKSKLIELIKEELENTLNEALDPVNVFAGGWWLGLSVSALINSFGAESWLREGFIEIGLQDGTTETVAVKPGETINSPDVKARVVDVLNKAVQRGSLPESDVAGLTPSGRDVDMGDESSLWDTLPAGQAPKTSGHEQERSDIQRSLELAREYGLNEDRGEYSVIEYPSGKAVLANVSCQRAQKERNKRNKEARGTGKSYRMKPGGRCK